MQVLWDVSLSLESRPESLRIGRKVIRQLALLAGASDVEAAEIELSAGEALTNAQRHAYPQGTGTIGIEVQAFNAQLSVIIHNDGKEVAAPPIPNALPDRQDAGGRGLYLIDHLMDDVEIGIDAQGHGVILRMTRNLEQTTR